MFEAVRIGEGVYWDGLYSQNPPISHLTDLEPDEIWIVQINPEELTEEPRTTADIWDRRNELAGNLSLNQELAFVRRTNALIRKHGIDKPTARVHRIELPVHLDAASKLDRSPDRIDDLMRRGEEQAALFLETVRELTALETAWADGDAEAVVEHFTEEAKIAFSPPTGSPAEEATYVDGQEIRRLVERGMKIGLRVEQSRDHRLVAEKASCWVLVTADRLRTPAKFRAEAIIREEKIEALTFRPLDEEAAEALRLLTGP